MSQNRNFTPSADRPMPSTADFPGDFPVTDATGNGISLSEEKKGENKFAGNKTDLRALRNWNKDYPAPVRWNIPFVCIRMIRAYRTLAQLPDTRDFRPAEFSTAWPRFSLKLTENRRKATLAHGDKTVPKPVASIAEITQAEQLLDAAYSAYATHPIAIAHFQAWAYARYRNIPMTSVMARFSVSKRALMESVNIAASACAAVLNEAGIRPI